MNEITPRAARQPRPEAHQTMVISGWIGSLALLALGVVHLAVNLTAYASLDPKPSWLLLLGVGVGPSVLAWLIAAASWRLNIRPVRGLLGVATVAVTTIGALLLTFQAVGVLSLGLSKLLQPLGPGPWSAIAGPALAVQVIAWWFSVRGAPRPATTG